jgi:photosystem II stability/assembly factor-like uncharacterized protein
VSDDRGISWRQLENGPRYSRESGLTLKRIWQIVPGAPSEPETFYAGVDEAGLFVSRDGGEIWQEVEGLRRHPSRPAWAPANGGLCLHTLLVDPANPRRLWAAISNGGIFRTVDGGENWESCHSGLPGHAGDCSHPEIHSGVIKLARNPHHPETLYMQHRAGVFRSMDGAASWEPLNEGLPGGFGFPICLTGTGDLYVVPLDRETRCFIDGKIELYRLKEGSARWERAGTGLPRTPHFVGVLRDALAVDPLEPPGIYFGTTQGDLFCSPDGGENWDRFPGQFTRVTTVKTWVLDGEE